MSGKGSFAVFIRIASCWVALLASDLALGQVASVVDLGANAEVHAINANGDITGCAPATDGATHAFIYSAGTMTDLGTLGGTVSCGFALNGTAQVTGYATTAGGLPHAFLYASGSMTDLGTVDSGTWSVGTGITASGVVVGYEAIGNLGNPAQVPAIDLSPLDLFHLAAFGAGTGGFFTDVFLYQNGVMALQLPPSPSLMTFNPSVFATGINDSGVVIGASASSCGILCPAGQAFTFQGGIATAINDTIDFFTAPLGINAAGVVVGYGEDGHADSNGFILADGAITYLGTDTRAYAINLGGDVVGISNAGLYNADSASATAFLYRNGIMSSLNMPGAVPRECSEKLAQSGQSNPPLSDLSLFDSDSERRRLSNIENTQGRAASNTPIDASAKFCPCGC